MQADQMRSPLVMSGEKIAVCIPLRSNFSRNKEVLCLYLFMTVGRVGRVDARCTRPQGGKWCSCLDGGDVR